MRYDFPSEIKTMIADRMATGKYGTEDEVLRRALRTLAEYDEAITDITEPPGTVKLDGSNYGGC